MERLMDNKIGWGDVLVMFAFGCTVPFPELIYLFSGSFVIAALTGVFFMRQSNSIPLAGILVLVYCFYFFFKHSTHL